MTESRCAARRRRQSMTARLPLHRMRNCTLPRSALSACWRCGTLCLASQSDGKLGDRDALIDQLWSAIERLPDPEPQPGPKRPSKQDVVIAMLRQPEGATVDEVASVTGWQRHTVRGVFSGSLKKKLGLTLASAKEERGRVSAGKRMKPASNDASARQHSGEPSPVRHRNGNRHNPPRRPDLTEVERQIAGLANRSSQYLRVAWRQLHRTGPPLRLSRDLLIRAIAHRLQEQSYGGVRRALRRRLQSLAGASEKAKMAVDPGLVLKAGTTLVRQWRGHAHCPRPHRRVRARRPALSVANGNCRADYRGPLVGSAVLWPDQTRECFGWRQDRPVTRPTRGGTKRNARVRCAIYTRKSSEEGLEQEFNSLPAQREACEAFITSQRHEGWVCLRAGYDDGGFSGATLDRPALQRLLADIAAGRVDIVVVYKIDRLTRSLADFAKIVEILDARSASFVSVTQQFNTTTSMGRLTLNV